MVCDQCFCGNSNRKNENIRMSLESCTARCISNDECKGIEYWSGTETSCYDCLNPQSTSSYTYVNDAYFPPSVYRRGNKN